VTRACSDLDRERGCAPRRGSPYRRGRPGPRRPARRWCPGSGPRSGRETAPRRRLPHQLACHLTAWPACKTVGSVTAELARADAGRVLLAMLRTVAGQRDRALRPWTGSWTSAPDNPSAVSAVSAMIRVVCAASAHGAWGRTSHNPPVVGSSPTRPTSYGTLHTEKPYKELREPQISGESRVPSC
jgi:hypothetical protein